VEEGEEPLNRWWESFNDKSLNGYVEQALEQNYSIKQAYARLEQAKALLIQAKSSLYPSLSASLYPKYCYVKDLDCDKEQCTGCASLCAELSYEVDLWNKIRYDVQSKRHSACSYYEQMEAAALLITGKIVDVWFLIQEKNGLVELINSQIAVSKTLLDLMEFRFAIGLSSILDVYQQKLQFEETKTQLIPIENELKLAQNAFYVLLGLPPMGCLIEAPKYKRVQLPSFPSLGTPKDLICRRPDLRAAYESLKAADYDTARAVADLYPSVCIPLSFELFTTDLCTLFEQYLFKVGVKVFEPIFDGFRRRAVVCQKSAVTLEKLECFREKFLVAMQEVEDAIATEKAQLHLIKEIDKQIDLAEKNLELAKMRYANGLNDYLTVIAAIQTLQRLQRRVVHEQKVLYTSRANLYRALGARCLVPMKGGSL